MSYYVAEKIVREHLRQHSQYQRNIQRINFCVLCYSRPRNTNRSFQKFWNWITVNHNANTYTGYTVEILNNLRTHRDNSQFGIEEITRAISALIASVRYDQSLITFAEVCYHTYRLFLATGAF